MRRIALALALIGALGLLAGAVALLRPGGRPAARPVPAVDRGTVPAVDRGTDPVSTAPHDRGRLPSPAPPAGTRLRIERIGADAPVGWVRAVGGVMDVPLDPHRVGWWRDGARPGAERGSAVLVGHVNYGGVDGALADLPQLHPGDAVSVVEPATTLRYRVAAVRVYPKTAGIPADAFDRQGPARLVLITCGGDYDAASRNYVDNVVVYAVPG